MFIIGAGFIFRMDYFLSVKFAKTGLMKYISHLDLMRLFGRALRRTDFAFVSTCGFNKHPKISIRQALKLGLESDKEEVVFSLTAPVSEGEFKEKLQRQLPEGIRIIEVDKRYAKK